MNDKIEIDQKFQIRRQGRKLGPFNLSQIEQMMTRRQLAPKDEIVTLGSNDWQRVDQWQRDRQPDLGPKHEPESPVTNGDKQSPDSPAPPRRMSSPGGWFVAIDGNTQGPLDENTLGQWISQRRINAETLVWRSGMQDWKSAREVLPAALNSERSTPSHTAGDIGQSNENYASRDLHRRRAFWVLTTCVITYIIAFESLACGVFQIYAGVATRHYEDTGLIALSAIASLIFACLLLMAAIEMTKLRSAMGRVTDLTDASTLASHEHRVWFFAGLSASFVILYQIVLAIYLLIKLADAT